MNPLRLALIGSRGIPANYGGYETLIEELATRLVRRGHDVTVYCRSHYTSSDTREHHGVRLRVLPTIRTKHLDTPVHSLLSCLDAAPKSFDAALVVNSANAMFVPLLRSAEIPVALHVDGIEQRRAKWGALGRTVYRVSERLAGLVPDILITDAQVVRDHYLQRWNIESRVITYGVEPRFEPPGALMAALDLEPRNYFLYVSRFEPENNPHRIVDAYRHLPTSVPLVMVGDAPYAAEFIASMKARADPRVRFPGAIYGRGYRELLSHAFAYIHATEVGGTHPALVEAMGFGNGLIVNDTPENRETAGHAALYFDVERPRTLVEGLATILEDDHLIADLRQAAATRAERLFNWESVTDRYAQLFRGLTRDW